MQVPERDVVEPPAPERGRGHGGDPTHADVPLRLRRAPTDHERVADADGPCGRGLRAATFGGWGIDYVALGHLHGPQRVTVPDVSRDTAGHGSGSATVARYSGSPLAFSFSELHQRKSTTLVDLDRLGAGGDPDAAVELVPAPVPRRLAEVTGTLDDLLGETGEPHVDDWLRVVVTDAVRPAELYGRVRARFPHALQVTHRPPRPAEREVVTAVGPGRDPLDVARDFVEHVSGHAPSDAEVAVLRAAFELALAEERSA